MKLTISGKEYVLPDFSAADFDDWTTEIEAANNTAKDKNFMQVQSAAIRVIVGFVQACYPELTDERAIKKAIPSRSVIQMFAELLYGKKDDAPPTPAGA
jgi:hypothetical protein